MVYFTSTHLIACDISHSYVCNALTRTMWLIKCLQCSLYFLLFFKAEKEIKYLKTFHLCDFVTYALEENNFFF